MEIIYKYPIEYKGSEESHLLLPRGAEILEIDFEGTELKLWARINRLTSEKEKHSFYILPTGASFKLPIRFEHIATRKTQVGNLTLVYHIFHKSQI